MIRDELYDWSYDAGLYQIIVELLVKSHQAPKMRPKIYFKSRIDY